jgi:hypothetical protein
MANLADGIIALQQMGVADVLLPFLLIFTLVFAVLQKSKILGQDSKKFNVIVAMVMGLALIFPHILGTYPPQSDPVNIINGSLPSISVVIVAIVMVMLLLGVFGAQFDLATGVSFWIMLVCVGIVVYVFGTTAGFFGDGQFPRWLWFLEDPNTQALLVMILVFGIIIYFITKEDKHEEDKDPKHKWITMIPQGKH